MAVREKVSTEEGTPQRGVLLMLCAQVGVLHAGQSMILPILPLFAQTFGVSLAVVGLLIAAQAVPRLFVSVPAGRLADRIGAHRMLAIACAISAIASVGSMLAPTFWFLVCMRVVQAIATAGSQTAGLTYAAGIGGESRRGRKISAYQGSFLTGNAAGPVVGGFLAYHFSYRVPFGVFAVVAVIVSLWVLWKLPDNRTAEHHHPGSGAEGAGPRPNALTLRQMLMMGVVLSACLAGLLSAYSRSGSRDYAMIVLSDARGIDTGLIGLALTILFLVQVAMMWVIGVLTDRFGPRAVMGPSWVFVGAGLVVLATSSATWGLFVAALLYGFGAGFANAAPAVQIANTVHASSRGAALGLFRTFNDLGLVLGAVAMSLAAATIGVTYGVWFNALLVFAAAATYVVGRRRREPPEQAADPSSPPSATSMMGTRTEEKP